MFDALIDHLNVVESGVNNLSPNGAFGFALACVERQLPVYQRASIGRPWTLEGIRDATDQAWNRLIDDVELTPDFIEQCRECCPADDYQSDASVVAANLISNSAIDLLTAIRDGEASYCHFPAYRNIDLLELLCDELNESESIEQLKQLIDVEIEHQNQDLCEMKESTEPDRLQRIRVSSRGKSLFNEIWFPD